jgi:histidinol-phosphate aminotransferase
MSRFFDLVTEHARTLGSSSSKVVRHPERGNGVSCIKLASNESPFGPSPRSVEAMQGVLASCNYYPDNDASELRLKLADRHGLQPENVLVTAGSSSLLGIIAQTLLVPGLNAVTSQRSFVVYSIATKAAGGKLVEVPMREDTFDLDAILAAIDRSTRIVFLANPNNPTGTVVAAPALDRFLARVPPNVIVVVDEAYYDFAEYFAAERGIEYSHSLDYVRQSQNVVVLRTFSKAHGLAGVRVGYGLGPAELMGYFARMRTAFAVSVVAQAAALAAFGDEAHVRKVLANNAEQAKWLAFAISGMGYRVVPSWANFLYCNVGEDAGLLARRLESEGVLVRALGAWGAPTAIRVTIGTPEQNQFFLKTFRKVMERTPAR